MPPRTTGAAAIETDAAPAVPGADRDVAVLLRRLSARYCWDSSPERAVVEADRVILRTCNVGTWEDTLDLERVVGHPAIRATSPDPRRAP